MKVAILGYAREGQAALKHWQQKGNQLTICDMDVSVVVPEGVESHLGPDYLKDLDQFDLLVRTASLPPSEILKANPDAPTILDKVTTVTDEFYRVCPTKHIIGITGTKGKGTTSTLIAKLLEAAGKRVHLGGNIGLPALTLLDDTILPNDWVVLEESSFQLIDQKHSPAIAVCLMVVPEHLNWHTYMEEYTSAKQQLFNHMQPDDRVVFNRRNELSREITSISIAKHKVSYEVPGVGKELQSAVGAYVDGDTIFMDEQPVCKVSDVALLGRHNLENVCAAIAAVWDVIDQDAELVQKVVKKFSGLEHRLEKVTTVNEVTYYNDSFASTPDAAMAAMQAIAEPKVLIVGGFDRQLPIEHLAKAIASPDSHLRHVLIIGACAPRLVAALQHLGFDNYTVLAKTTMPEIVAKAQTLAHPGDAVVLSPGFASFDMFKNFEDRGQQFKTAVHAL